MPPQSPKSDPRRAAEEIFIQAVSLGEFDADRLARAHPDLVDHLRELHRDWEKVAHIHAALSSQGSLASRLKEHYGENVEADVELDQADGASDSMPSRIVRELEGHAPRHQRYRLLGEVARGGMGAVLKVWDSDLRRPLAMKVMLTPKEELDDPDSQNDRERALSRFLEEAQVTGQLDHPGIVPVHEMGLDATGRVFFTMRLVRGSDLEHILDLVAKGEEGWTLNRALRVLMRMCEAMAYSHSKGVVHRDLKPANIMVGRFGEVYVMDWGLARVLGREDKSDLRVKKRETAMMSIVKTARADERTSGDLSPLMTMDGEVLGTPAYMAPEQARGELDKLDQRADVYAAGAILYHLLAGHMPYVPPGERLGAFQVWEMVKEGPPAPLDGNAPDGPPELIAIADKAMARDPSERYPTMMELAEDLTNFLDGRVVRAFETGAAAELRKWVRRNRLTAGAVAASIVLAIGGLASVAYLQANAKEVLAKKNDELTTANEQARTARDLAEEQRTRADENAEVALERRREADLLRGQAEQRAVELARERDSGDRVIEFLVELFESPDPSRARGETITAKALLDRGAKSIADDERTGAEWSRLRGAMGRAYRSLGLYDDAEPLLTRALADRREDFGPDDAPTLLAELDLARLYIGQGRYDDAEPLLEHARSGWETFGSANESTRLDTLDALGLLRFYQARYDEALSLFQSASDGWAALRGEDSTHALRSRRHIAMVQRKEQRYYEALETFRDVLDGLRNAYEDDHPATLQAINDLAGVHVFLEDNERARPLFEEALEGRMRVLGGGHPDTLVTLNDLAYLLMQEGDFQAAEPLYEKTIAGKREALGATHPETLTSMNNLAALYFERNRFEEAETLYREAVAGTLEARGEEHPHTAGVRFGLASALYSQRKLDEARTVFADAYKSAQAAFGEDNENTMVILESYVRLMIDLAAWEDAEVLALELMKNTPATHIAQRDRRAMLDHITEALEE